MKKPNSQKILVVLIWLLLPFWGNAQAQSDLPAPDNPESDFNLEVFTLPGGTNGNLVTSIVEGPNGFTWFGSFGGLHRYDGYEIKTYTKNPADTIPPTQSLLFDNIEHLFWDSQDKLWVSTFGGGLFRFDPITEIFQHFKYNAKDSLSISSPTVHYGVEDTNGFLWFATRNGVNRFDRKTEKFQRFKLDPSQKESHQNNNARVLYVDRQGTLWVAAGEFYQASLQGGLFRFNPDTNDFIHYRPDPDNPEGLGHAPIRGLYEDRQGNFWVGANGGLYKMNRAAGTFEKMPYHPNQPHAPEAATKTNTPVWSFLEDQNQGLWIGTLNMYGGPPTNSLLRYDPILKTTEELPLKTYAWQLSESADGTIWAAGSAIRGHVTKITRKDKLYDLQEGTVLFENFQNQTFFQDKPFVADNLGGRDITIDTKNGTLWVRTVYRDNDSLHVFLVAENNPAGVAELFELNDLQVNFDGPSSGFSNVGMAVGADGKIWNVLDQNGIFSFDPSNQKTVQYKHNPLDTNSLSSNEIVRMIMDSNGDLWAAGHTSGLNRLHPTTGEVTRYNFPIVNGLPTNGSFPIALLEDKQGQIWVGGYVRLAESNLFRPFMAVINPVTNEQTDIPLPDKIKNSSIRFFTQDPITGIIAFTLWNQGFGVYDIKNQTFDFFTPEDSNFPINQIATLLFDEAGILWAASRDSDTFAGSGFARIDLEKEDIYLFGSKHPAINENRNAFVGPEGLLYFKNVMGWSKVNPEEIKPPAALKQGAIKLVEFVVAGTIQNPFQHTTLSVPVQEAKMITLNHNDEAFSFQFSDFNFKKSNSNFQYRLFPYESKWKSSGATPVATYFKVPSGNYEFQVKARQAKGAKIESLKVQLMIKPPWWNTWWAYGLYGLGAIAFFYFVHRFQKERVIRAERTKTQARELAQAKEIEKAYHELKNTQALLVQAEKMASLGELTAGIAHEIQNPLNFVNNFSEVSGELLEEMKEELAEGNKEEMEDLMGMLTQNLEKINHHGNRASGIVKGMLAHSRTGSATQKEPTDLNSLCDEYLRLAYHGLRAKDSSFNASYETDFDAALPKLEVVPQDIGRVVLNLINNAFYVVNEKAKEGIAGYEPKVVVSTETFSPAGGGVGGGHVQISVTDNGKGIPKANLDKIFQPFFTTKPTGQGTGLGLSLSYDIIKAHGGELKVESEEGNGTTFHISLPK